MTKRISIDKQASINLGLGMFTQFSRDLLFDIAPTIQYEYDITDNLGLSQVTCMFFLTGGKTKISMRSKLELNMESRQAAPKME